MVNWNVDEWRTDQLNSSEEIASALMEVKDHKSCKADYRFVEETPEIVFIEDLNLGGKSITNDAEAVVETLLSYINPKLRIVYKNICGNWDELLHDGKKFIDFAPYNGYTPVT